MSRTLTFDFRRGGGSPVEFLYGEVLLEPTAAFTAGGSTVLPSPTKIPLVNGVASVAEVEESPSGANPAWAYNVTARDTQTGRAWSRLVGVPAGTGTVNFKDLPVYSFAGSAGPDVVVVPHAHAVATTTAAGFMSASDKVKLDASIPGSNLVWSQAAGRTLTVWDTANSRPQLVYGDTGERDISELLVNATGVARLQRTGNTVHLYLQAVVPTTTNSGVFLTLPSGFRPVTQRAFQLNTGSAGTAYRSAYMFNTGGVGVWLPATTDSYSFTYSFPTSNPWPTSLPGTAVGSIPA